MRRRVLPSLIASAAVVVAAAGCGVSDVQTRPGVAAELEGQTLELDKVDRAVEDYCTLLAAKPELTATSMAKIRAEFAIGWTQALAIEDLAEEAGLPLPSDVVERPVVETSWEGLGAIDDENYDSFAWLTWIQQRLELLDLLGAELVREETGQQTSPDGARARGIEALTDWLEEHEPELNPVFGEYDAETSVFRGDTLSVPVSDLAVAADEGGGVDGLTLEEVAALPDTQRCGAAPQVQPGA